MLSNKGEAEGSKKAKHMSIREHGMEGVCVTGGGGARDS